MPHRIAGGFIGWIAMTVIRTERTISNSPLFTLASWAQAAAGTKHWLCCDQGDSSGAGNTAVNTANINTFNTTHGVLFSLQII